VCSLTALYALRVTILFVLASAATAPAAEPTSRPVLAPASRPSQRASLWGPAVDGVQARLFIATEVEQDALVPIRLEIADDPGHLPAGTERFDTFLLQTRVAISMTNLKTGKSVTVGPLVPVNGIPTMNMGSDFVRLDGTPIPPFKMEIALRPAGAALEPGEYDCVLRCPFEGQRPQWLMQAAPQVLGAGWWSGKFETAAIVLLPAPLFPSSRFTFPNSGTGDCFGVAVRPGNWNTIFGIPRKHRRFVSDSDSMYMRAPEFALVGPLQDDITDAATGGRTLVAAQVRGRYESWARQTYLP
jgi:hypothetical protein